jgi:hypothetical protein
MIDRMTEVLLTVYTFICLAGGSEKRQYLY